MEDYCDDTKHKHFVFKHKCNTRKHIRGSICPNNSYIVITTTLLKPYEDGRVHESNVKVLKRFKDLELITITIDVSFETVNVMHGALTQLSNMLKNNVLIE
jgi:hypothetical protein